MCLFRKQKEAVNPCEKAEAGMENRGSKEDWGKANILTPKVYW